MSLLQHFRVAQAELPPWLYGLGKDRPAPEVAGCSAGVTSCLTLIFNWAFRILIYVGGGLAVIMLILAGITFITGGANPETVKKSRGYLIWAAVGLVVALVAYGLVQFLEAVISSGDIGWLPTWWGASVAQAASDLNFQPTGIKCGGTKPITIFKSGGGIVVQAQENIWRDCLLWFADKVLRVVYTVALLVSVGFIIYTGFQYVQSGGKVQDIHSRLVWIIIGVSITILAYAIVKALEISLTQR